MLTKTKQKLSHFRKQGSPLASIVDFSLWTARSGLNPKNRGFWFVCLLNICFVTAWFLTPYRLLIVNAAILFFIIVLVSLLLSYFRTISRTFTHALAVTKQDIGGSLVDIREKHNRSTADFKSTIEQHTTTMNGKLNDTLTSINRHTEATTEKVETELDIVGQRMIELAEEIQSLRVHSIKNVSEIAERQDIMDSQLSSLNLELSTNSKKIKRYSKRNKQRASDILSNVDLIKTRLDSSSANEARTIEYLCDSVDELKRQLLEISSSNSDDA